jgi:hypothetical protein
MQELSTQHFPAFTGLNPNAITPAAQGGDRTFQAIFNTVAREMPQIPLAVQRLIEWFREFHNDYRWYKLKNVQQIFTPQQARRSNESSAQAAFYGHAISRLANISDYVNYAVNLAVITKCTLDILNKYRELRDSLRELQNALCLRVATPDLYPVNNVVHTFSLSIFVSWNLEMSSLLLQTVKIVHCTLKVLFKAFELSMILEDTRLFFTHDTQTRFVACTELVEHWQSYSNLLNDELGRSLEAHQPLAREILTELGENNSNQIIDGLVSQLRTGVQSVRTFLRNNQGSSSSASLLPFDGSGNFQRSTFRVSTIPQRTSILNRSTR